MCSEPVTDCIASLSFTQRCVDDVAIDKMQPCFVQLVEGGKAMSTASEDDWQRRLRHRCFSTACVKASSHYAASRGACVRPVTPDPEDQEISKRTWKKLVQIWRNDVKAVSAPWPASWRELRIE